jgi:hypothetical protein
MDPCIQLKHVLLSILPWILCITLLEIILTFNFFWKVFLFSTLRSFFKRLRRCIHARCNQWQIKISQTQEPFCIYQDPQFMKANWLGKHPWRKTYYSWYQIEVKKILVLTYVEEATMLAHLNLRWTNSQRCLLKVAYFFIWKFFVQGGDFMFKGIWFHFWC